ncbi:energy transducer TonB [Aquabacterium olei]|uniref:Energy transducer TonB n=1 Tax=Aquabacterium olei TaxID=1296669 RepID=A0A2U8FU91_9BURK|nr:energy transducer TonB [Aquabacterium olei]AWI54641.1 energy transducer TonB [Aquabacterium olei]
MLNRLKALWTSLSLLQVCLGVSVLVHAALFSFRLVDPEGFNRVFKDTPLEVVLVNAASNEAPTKAQALAQANLAGGGEADRGRATSPLPPSPENTQGDAVDDAMRMIEQMQREQQLLLTQVRQELAALPPPQPDARTDTPQQRAEEERRRQLTRLLAEIEKRIREENARPKKRYLSPATLKSADALYYAAFRTRVERAGTDHFPTGRNGEKLYGELVMFISLDRQGRVIDTEVRTPSGNRLLDKRAAAIVRQAGPFGAVPPEVSTGHDLLVISSRFRFTRDAGMQATTMAPTAPTEPATQP